MTRLPLPDEGTTTKAATKSAFAALSVEKLRQVLAPAAAFLCLLALVSVAEPTFLGGAGPAIIAQQATPILLVALGQCIVLQIGSIDFSNAALALLCTILAAMTLGPLGATSPLLCVAIVTAIGALNGVVLVFAQIPSFALTLGTLGVLQAPSLVVTGSNVVYVMDNQDVVAWLFNLAFLTLPVAFWIAALLAVGLWAFMRLTPAGQGMAAIWYNERTATLSGLPVKALKVAAFALSGFFAGLAGLCVIAISGAVSSIGLGSDLPVPSIAAALAGGTAVTGGVCNPINVIFGALFVALIPVGSAVVGVNPQAQAVVYGAVLIVAVAATMSRSRSGIVK